MKNTYVKGDWKVFTMTVNGCFKDVSEFIGVLLDFLSENNKSLYKKSHHRIHLTANCVDSVDDWHKVRCAILGKEELFHRLQRFLYIEQKEQHFADYSLSMESAQSERACDW